MSEDTCRLDAYLVQAGHASGREKAKELLAAGYVSVNGVVVDKPARRIGSGDTVICAAPSPRYVGRGGLKLEKAIESAGLCLDGMTAMDVGASTGGFTDCMLQHGAAHVYAVDVGHDQLHPALRQDSRVTVLEGTDVRSPALAATVSAGSVDVCSIDVSFVSLTHVLPSVLSFVNQNGVIICLIKPQFEAGRAAIGKRGVVRDKKVHVRVLKSMACLFSELNWMPVLLTHSPVTGGEGNIEYVAVLRRSEASAVCAVDVVAVADAAFAAFKE